MTFAKDERAQLCDLFVDVGPDAPTLCEGWTTHDLAAHLWVRETDPVGAPGILAKPLAALTERRMVEVKNRWPYQELVQRIARGPARFSIFSLPGLDEPANATEFFVHHEDVRRAGDQPAEPRDLGDEIEDWIWRRLKLLGRAFFRRASVGVMLERTPQAAGREPEQVRAQTGNPIVTIVGRPSELVLYGNGRTQVAEVELIGEQEAIDALRGTDLAI
jgi:uncharacterized protein (TIGR03085 family)